MFWFNILVFLTVAYGVLVVADKQKTVWIKNIGYVLSGLIATIVVVSLFFGFNYRGHFFKGDRQMMMMRDPQMKMMMKEKCPRMEQDQQQKPVENKPAVKTTK